MKILIIFSRVPYDGTDVGYNGLRLAKQLFEDGHEVRIFLINDAVDIGRIAAKPPAEYDQDLSLMLKNLLDGGMPARACTSCISRCGIYKNQPLFENIKKSHMPDFSRWVGECDRVITF